MTYAATAARTTTTTTTEARVRYVMGKVIANFNALVVCGLISPERAANWSDDLTYLQLADALAGFEVQFDKGRREPYGLSYRISNDGSVQQDSPSGGLDLYGIPESTPVSLCLDLRPGKYAQVLPYLERRGWKFSGKLMASTASESRSFSSGGYAITRSKLGTWP